MFRLLRSLGLPALAFVAGVQFERAGAAATCEAEEMWGAYIECVARETLEEVVS